MLQWHAAAETQDAVQVAGSFNNWAAPVETRVQDAATVGLFAQDKRSQNCHLQHSSPHPSFPPGTVIHYKFVVNGVCHTDGSSATETDPSTGAVNNVLVVVPPVAVKLQWKA